MHELIRFVASALTPAVENPSLHARMAGSDTRRSCTALANPRILNHANEGDALGLEQADVDVGLSCHRAAAASPSRRSDRTECRNLANVGDLVWSRLSRPAAA